MKLTVLAVGHRQPDWVTAGCAEYLKRMPRELPASVTEIKPEPRGAKTREQLLAAEKGPHPRCPAGRLPDRRARREG